MSAISTINQRLIQSQLDQVRLQQEIDIRVAKKALDANRMQADAALALLDEAGEMARQLQASDNEAVSLGALVSGLGRQLDVRA
ncbi:MAG: hypothetical protein JW810_04165 [Sedimentisphaerales bacterium]|nr:hypothetical protein [Sedimentisphaerales bacterium]